MKISLGAFISLCLFVVTAHAQYAVNDVVQIGYYQEVEPFSGFGFEQFKSPQGLLCGIGFGGSVKILYVMQPNTDHYFVQYTPTTNPNGVLNECKGTLAYFQMQEQNLQNQQGIRNAVVANPPQ